MAPKFGTSGLRGLVTELTPALVRDHVAAFLSVCPHGGTLFVGRDLRPSSPDIAAQVMAAAAARDVAVVDCGVLPTPALAMASMAAGGAAVMVTGSHIPADRNGLKFYTPTGEITKSDETAILGALETGGAPAAEARVEPLDAAGAYARRYTDAYGAGALSGLRIGVYQHSSVARDLMVDVLRGLGAETVALARADHFVPVDTEAVDAETRTMLAGWCAEHGLDAVVSTDGDADRPMLTDATGRIVPGDVLGALTARALGAAVLCTPVSANTLIDAMPDFAQIHRTRIGSPYVIAAMEAALAADPQARVVGFEPNGGFLLGFAAEGPAGPLAPLPTRDCLLPVVAPLHAAARAGGGLADLVAGLPARFTAADRIAGIPTDRSQDFIATLSGDAAARAAFFEGLGAEAALDETDGLRVTFADGDIVHLRPSGNAPEFRCYAEAGTADRAEVLVTQFLAQLRARLG